MNSPSSKMRDPSSPKSRRSSDKILRLKYYKDLKQNVATASDTFLTPSETYYIDANLFMVIQPSVKNPY